MILPGLVSVTFRQLSASGVVSLAAAAGLRGIEWGGDVHVPPGDTTLAGRVGRDTRDAGLQVACYGSYYRAGEQEPVRFETVLETAEALQAPLIRVWAGARGSSDCGDACRQRVVEDSARIGELALARGIRVAFEYHGKTLTDTNESALRLLKDVGHPNVKTLWQPSLPGSVEERAAGLKLVLPWLANLHVYHWIEEEPSRRALSEGRDEWSEYLRLAALQEQDRWALLEFVRDDSVEHFFSDARTLVSWLNEI